MICKTEGCGGKHFGLGYCRKHHARFKRNGTDISKYDMTRQDEVSIDTVKDTGLGRRGLLYVNIINDIKFKARKRGKEWDLSHAQAFKLITASCEYCGFKPNWPESRVGIDRVENDIGYKIENCVPCCFTCNSAKGDKTLEEFILWVERIHNHLNKI